MRLPARGWVVAGGIASLLVGALLVAEFQRPLNSDSAWLLHLAERVVRGDRLYVDLIEINPPLIVWLQIPIVFLAGRLGLDPISAFRIAVLAWIGLCLVLSASVLRSATVRARDRRWILLAIVLVALGWTRAHFGEREHLVLVALLPYLFLTAMVAQGRALLPALRIVVGFVAALGFTLKPHFLLVWIVCLLYVAWKRRTARWLLGVENLTILGFVILYGLVMVVAVPEYVSMVSRLASTYQAFARKSLDSLVLDSAEALCALGALFAYGLLRRSLRTREIGDVTRPRDWGFPAGRGRTKEGLLLSLLPRQWQYAATRGSGPDWPRWVRGTSRREGCRADAGRTSSVGCRIRPRLVPDSAMAGRTAVPSAATDGGIHTKAHG